MEGDLMSSDGARPKGHPRLVKLVRDNDRAQAIEALRFKLIEEAIEYLRNPSVGELADVLEIARALCDHDLQVPIQEVIDEATAKAWRLR